MALSQTGGSNLSAGLTITEDLDFNGFSILDIGGIGFENGQEITWNEDFDTINIPSGTGSTLQVGQEFYFKIHNDTGSLITNGQILKPISGIVVGSEVFPTVQLAMSDVHENCSGTLFVATSDIADGSEGMATRIGRATVDLSAFGGGDDLFLSSTVAGAVTNVRPTFPA